jgi:hypothetical protein
LYTILARDGRTAVVFRRGPTRHVLTLRWWLDTDVLEEGQWFNGRIYERRGDLSPDGELMIYMAAKWAAPLETWTAVSRAPYLTALALWKGHGAWGGGGVFHGRKSIGVNLKSLEAVRPKRGSLHAWHPMDASSPPVLVPQGYTAERVAEWAGYGEDNPICHYRMQRDGWRSVAEGQAGDYGADKNYAWVMQAPEVDEKAGPLSASGQAALVLRRELKAIGQRNGAWYVEDFVLRRADGDILRRWSNCSWGDWHVNGDVLFAIDGRLYRLPSRHAADMAADPLTDCKLVADLTPLMFKPRPAPDDALRWPT